MRAKLPVNNRHAAFTLVELMVVLVVTDSGRPLARIGGLTKEEAKYEDGLR